ncbi:MAG: type secretion system protein [Microbacteriaceae bacterium]|nr:type secretion system protein [Microbacteriaceae bacterium]
MTVVLGLMLGFGLVLVASPALWPAGGITPKRTLRLRAAALERLAQAGLGSVSPGGLLLVSVLCALAGGALAFVFLPVVALSAIIAVAALALPMLVVMQRAAAHRRAALVLWPDVVDHLVSAVRSGLALPDSVVSLAQVGPVAMRSAFSGFALDYRSTGNFSLSVDQLKGRLADPVADRILETLRMSREVGGSELTAVLRALSESLRRESAIRSEVQARQSWTINAARLGVAAPWLILVMLATRPEAAAAYNTPSGGAIITGGLVLSVIAYRVMLRLGRMPQEKRWFR